MAESKGDDSKGKPVRKAGGRWSGRGCAPGAAPGEPVSSGEGTLEAYAYTHSPRESDSAASNGISRSSGAKPLVTWGVEQWHPWGQTITPITPDLTGCGDKS